MDGAELDEKYSPEAEAAAAADREALEAMDAEELGFAAPDPEVPDETGVPELDEVEIPWLKEARRKQELVLQEATPVDLILLKLDAWLLQQPEWMFILSAPRATRRKAINLISKHLLTYPARGKSFGGFTP